jgi:hypothetical protein
MRPSDQHFAVIRPADRGRRGGVRLQAPARGDVLLDIIDQHRAAWRHRRPHSTELKPEIAAGVRAVVDEEVDFSEVGDEAAKESPT